MDREDLPTLAHTSLAEATTELLRERIIQGTFAPGERHAVSSDTGARVLLLLAPWPGDGHYHAGEAQR